MITMDHGEGTVEEEVLVIGGEDQTETKGKGGQDVGDVVRKVVVYPMKK